IAEMPRSPGCVVAMTGRNCVAIASDHMFGDDESVLSVNCPKVFRISPLMYMGIVGLHSDAQMVHDRLMFRKRLYEGNVRRPVSPTTFAGITSNLLYEHRFGPYLAEPVLAALDPRTLQPYICSMDVIGARNVTNDFVVAGSCTSQLFGMCETLWRPNLDPPMLFEVISQSLMSSFGRDIMSGCGATVFVIEKDKVRERVLQTRMD
ncbi:hypothetical protein KR018_000406, partial [Drosophila ironensis]